LRFNIDLPEKNQDLNPEYKEGSVPIMQLWMQLGLGCNLPIKIKDKMHMKSSLPTDSADNHNRS